MTTRPSIPQPQPEAAPPRRRLPVWIALLLAVLALAGLPLVTGWSLLHSPLLLGEVLNRLPGLSATGVSGSLAGDDLRIAAVDIQLPGQTGRLQLQDLALSGASLSRAPGPLWRPRLVAHRLTVRSLRYTSGESTAADVSPPADLQLPLAILIDELLIAQLNIDDLPPAQALRARIAFGDGAAHRVDQLSLRLGRGDWSGSASLDAVAPLALKATLKVRSLPAEPAAVPAGPASASTPTTAWRPWHATLMADGRLAAIDLAAELADDADPRLALSAKLQVQPFARWPVTTMLLQVQRFDIAALAADWPATALTGSARIAGHGPADPLQVSAKLVNEAPRRVDEGGLPLRSVSLSGVARAAGEPGVEDLVFDVALGAGPPRLDAGHWRGSGRWRGDELRLTTTLDAVRPEQLDARAIATVASGPLNLTLTGLPRPGSAASAPAGAGPAAPIPPPLRIAFDARLDGRGARNVPVRLAWSGSAQIGEVVIDRLDASAGNATAQADLRLSRIGRIWQARSAGNLQRFDPLAWWPGGAGSPWRRGTNRLEGDWRFALAVPPAGGVARPVRLWATGSDPAAPGGRVADSVLRVTEALRGLRGDATLNLADSLLVGTPVSGHWTAHADDQASAFRASLAAAGNRLDIQVRLDPHGGTGTPGNGVGDGLDIDIAAPQLAALTPLIDLLPGTQALGLRDGQAHGRISLKGRWPKPTTRTRLSVDQLRFTDPALPSVTHAELDAEIGPSDTSPLRLDFRSSGWAQAGRRIDRLDLLLSGTRQVQHLNLVAESPARPPTWIEPLLGATGNGTRLSAQAQSALVAAADGWRLRITDGRLQLAARTRESNLTTPARTAIDPGSQATSRTAAAAPTAAPTATPTATPAAWLNAAALSADATWDSSFRLRALDLAPGRLTSAAAVLRWNEARWQTGTGSPVAAPRLTLNAAVETVDAAALLARLQPGVGWQGDLRLAGTIAIDAGERFAADARLSRVGGDLRLVDERGREQALGFSELSLALSAHDGVWQFAQGFAGSGVGEAAGAQVVRVAPQRWFPTADAPLQGVVGGKVRSLALWANWVPPGWRLAGSLETSADIAGTLGAPEFGGRLSGNDLVLRNPLQGIHLSDGMFALSLRGDHAEIEQCRFTGGDGSLQLRGSATLGAAPRARLTLAAEHFRVFGRVDRRLVVSGQAALDLSAARLNLSGQVGVDEGSFDFSRGDVPTLSDDVTVIRPPDPGAAVRVVPEPEAAPPVVAAPQRETQVEIGIDLGDRLQVHGHGLDTGLRGKLVLGQQGGRVVVNGRLRTDGGTYAAYAQKLVIDKGDLMFNGPFDNPRLDIVALRPDLDVRVGVVVTGSAQSPRARLFSEPDMPDNDKLSWLLLGRASDGLGRSDSALLQRAAVALLAGEGRSPTDALIERLGLTDLSLRQADTDSRETIVSLGRQLSRRWYAGYERSLNATAGTWQLVYRLAQRFTLRAQSGADNSLDVIWSWRWE
jgi:translocation and assembly module TamB